MRAFQLEDGAEMAYADEGAGPPILLVHGWGTHAGFFADFRARLKSSHRVVSVTLRGHPGSSRGTAPQTIETLGHDLARFISALNITELSAIGWSMGAMALWSALPSLNPGRLERLVVVEMTPKVTNAKNWMLGLSGYAADDVERSVAAMLADWPAYTERFAPRMFAPATRQKYPVLVNWVREEMKRCDPVCMASYWRSMAAQDFRAALASVEVPTLVIRGEESEIYPDGATAFVADVSPLAKRHIVRGAGHAPHLERPEVFYELIEEFLLATTEPKSARRGAQVLGRVK